MPDAAKSQKSFFERVKKMARKRGISGMQKDARDFFRKAVNELAKGYTAASIMKEKPELLRNKTNFGIGKMYLFVYDPKHKKTLPYYDTVPLVIPIHRYSNGFLGLNLHYLHPNTRGLFLSKLADLASDTKMNENTKLKITYGLLKNAAKLREFRPCVKRYLNSHMRSRLMLVSAADWLPAIFLPVASFKKATDLKVWADSEAIIKGKKPTSSRKPKKIRRK